jgi:hypothetical protein
MKIHISRSTENRKTLLIYESLAAIAVDPFTSINQVTYIAPQIREKISVQGRFTSVILP